MTAECDRERRLETRYSDLVATGWWLMLTFVAILAVGIAVGMSVIAFTTSPVFYGAWMGWMAAVASMLVLSIGFTVVCYVLEHRAEERVEICALKLAETGGVQA